MFFYNTIFMVNKIGDYTKWQTKRIIKKAVGTQSDWDSDEEDEDEEEDENEE